MKTTVHIADPLLAEAQAIAAREKTTLKALISEGLQHVVDCRRKKQKPFKLRDASVKGEGLHPDVEGLSWDEIRALSYGKRGG